MSNIRKLRVNAKFNTDRAVKELGISKSMFYKIELGDRSPSKSLIVKMSVAYKCSIGDIFKALNLNKKEIC